MDKLQFLVLIIIITTTKSLREFTQFI